MYIIYNYNNNNIYKINIFIILIYTNYEFKLILILLSKVIEQGSHDELMSKKGSYYNLVMIQTGH